MARGVGRKHSRVLKSGLLEVLLDDSLAGLEVPRDYSGKPAFSSISRKYFRSASTR